MCAHSPPYSTTFRQVIFDNVQFHDTDTDFPVLHSSITVSHAVPSLCLSLTCYTRGHNWVHNVYWSPYGIIYDMAKHFSLPDCRSRSHFRQVGDRQASHHCGCDQWLYEHQPPRWVCGYGLWRRMGCVQYFTRCLVRANHSFQMLALWCGRWAKLICQTNVANPPCATKYPDAAAAWIEAVRSLAFPE